jgi:choline dehydrogenase-like flavoprotein
MSFASSSSPGWESDYDDSAGSFNSPKLLMLSGIGDEKALSNLHIPTIVDLPSVGMSIYLIHRVHPMLILINDIGQNMSDHVLLNNMLGFSFGDGFVLTYLFYTAIMSIATTL